MICNRTSESFRRLAEFGFIGTFYVTPVVHFWVEILDWISRRPFSRQWILNGPGGKGKMSQGVRSALLQLLVDQLTGTNENHSAFSAQCNLKRNNNDVVGKCDRVSDH